MDKYLRNNNFVKVLAVIIAIMLWIVVHMDTQTGGATSTSSMKEESISNVTVNPKYDSNQISIKSMQPSEVTVLLRWKDTGLRKVNTNNVKVELDLSNLGEGTHTVPVKTSGVPGSVNAEVIPSTVKVVLEKKLSKQVPVVINATGTPAQGYKSGQTVINPNRVKVTVPESRMDDIESARADVSVDKASSTVTKQVKLTAYDKNGKPVEGAIVNPQIVDVEIPITSPFKVMPLQIKLIGEPAAGFSIASLIQNPEQVTVYGAQDILNKMDFFNGPQLDITGWNESKQVTLDIPHSNKDIQVEPTKVDVQVEIVPSTTKTLENIPITITGQSDGMTAMVAPETGAINVVVEGAPAILNKLKPQDIQAIADVSKLPVGKHEVTLTFNLPMFVKKQANDFKAVIQITAKTTGGAGAGGTSPSTTPSLKPDTTTPSPTPGGTSVPVTKPGESPGTGGSSTPPAPTPSPVPTGSTSPPTAAVLRSLGTGKEISGGSAPA